jgi:hypothetical protein
MDAFYNMVDAHVQTLHTKYRAKYLIRKAMYEDIIHVLREGAGDPKFKFWVQKYFVLVEIGNATVVYNKGKDSHPVVIYEELYSKLNQCHQRVGHHGRDKTWNEVWRMCSSIAIDVSHFRSNHNIHGFLTMSS